PAYTSFTNSNYRGIADISADPYYQIDSDPGTFDIPVGNGYLFFFRGGETTSSPFSTGSTPDDGTLAATGALNQGSITVTNWYNEFLGNTGLLYTTTSSDPGVQGMNLVGNPYPSTIDWNTFNTTTPGTGIYTSGLSGAIYMLNPPYQAGGGNYASYIPGVGGTNNATNLIASGVGFFAQTISANATLQFNESAKVNTQVTSPALFMANRQTLATNTPVKQQIRLLMQLDSINNDEILINFNPKTKVAFNVMEDARYRVGTGKVSLASLSSDNIALAINQLPLATKGDTIHLKVGATASGTYSLKLKSVQGIPQIYDIWLKDAFAKDSVNLRNTGTYSFTVNTGDTTTFGSHRFVLTLQEDPALAYKLISFDAEKDATERRQVHVTWKTQNEADYTHFTVERSTDNGKTYGVIGGMLSSGQGTYDMTDRTPEKGNNLYRLKQEDFNKTITYSNVVTVQFSNNGNDKGGRVSCYPNPAKSNIDLSFVPKSQDKTTYNITISNSSGKVVKFAHVTDTNWHDNVSNLLTGTYLIQVTDKKTNNVIGQTKFVKL
ncbi:MAG: T9SS type A sorting domain-containing protein, partial [Mucilaginibacter sp.]